MNETAKKFKKLLFNADLRAGRANKPEILTDELRQVEKHMENVRFACQSTYKKLISCIPTHNVGDPEKRQSRLPENSLAQTMHEVSKHVLAENDLGHVFGNYLQLSSDAQTGLMKARASYEYGVDDLVITPLQTLVETEIPNIIKQREKVEKMMKTVQDRENAYLKAEKIHQTLQNTPNPTSPSLQQAANKTETLKEEHHDAVMRMQQCKDQLVTDMFEYILKEFEHTKSIAELHAKQLEYHKKCVEILKSLEPKFQTIQESAVCKKSFGKPLLEHLRLTERDIALPIEACVLCLLHFGIKEEGIFRITGGAAKLRMMKSLLEAGVIDLHVYDVHEDIHAVASALKQYLRDLPEPLLTYELFDEWMNAASLTEHNQKLQEVWTIIDKLPAENKANLRYLIRLCKVVADNHEVNKMTASNLALVIGPNLLWSISDDIQESVRVTKSVSNIIECVITYADWFFPGDIDFFVTPNATTYHNLVSSNHASPNSQEPEAIYENAESVSSNLPIPPVPLINPSKPKSHSRSSSSDTNLSDAISFSHKPTRKYKSKAPPPPPQAVQINAKSHEPSKSSPPATRPSVAEKPVAAKRSFSKKPQGPPPNPPKEENVENPISQPVTRKVGNGFRPPIPEKKFIKESNPIPKEKNHITKFTSNLDETPPPPKEWLTDLDSPNEPTETDGGVYTAL